MENMNYMTESEKVNLKQRVRNIVPTCSSVTIDPDNFVPIVEVTYSDFKPASIVRQMLEKEIPDAQFLNVQREYTLRAFSQAVIDHASDIIYVVDQKKRIVPLSLRSFLQAFVSNEDVSSQIDEMISNKVVL